MDNAEQANINVFGNNALMGANSLTRNKGLSEIDDYDRGNLSLMQWILLEPLRPLTFALLFGRALFRRFVSCIPIRRILHRRYAYLFIPVLILLRMSFRVYMVMQMAPYGMPWS